MNGSICTVQAQNLRQNQAPNWQKDLTLRYNQLRKQTLQLAQRNGWFLRKNYSRQRILQLQEIDPYGQPIYYTSHNTEAARGTHTLAMHGQGSLPIAFSGNSPVMAGRLGLWDGGKVLTTHQEFTGSSARIAHKNSASILNDHATHLAGTLVAQGINADAQGMAFGANLSVWDYTDDIIEINSAAPDLLISNHAYGPVVGWVFNESRPGNDPNLKWEWWGNTAISSTEDYLFGFYTTRTQDLDRIAYNNPFHLMVRSADNKRGETGPPDGTPYYLKNTDTQSKRSRSRNDTYDVIPAEATAKNVLTIGAANLTYADPNQPILEGTTGFSGWGPTDDGRIKPDLLGVGSTVFSTLASSQSAYGALSGTSMASANVAGSLFLLQELYAKQRAPGLPATGQFMQAATLKGLAIHTAYRQNPASGPDYRQGWGLLNTEAAARLLLNEELAHTIQEKVLSTGNSFSQTVVAQGYEPLIVTLCWADPEGSATPVTANSLNSRIPKLVNDLDLRLSDGMYVDMPFVMDPERPDMAASRGNNDRDNVEQVYIANPIPGKTYTLTVSHKGKLTYSSQPFSLITSGLKRSKCDLTANISPNRDTVLCDGSTLPLQLANPSTDLRYQWLRNGTTLADGTNSDYRAVQEGSYTLRITNEKGCSATSQPVHIQVKKPLAAVTPTGNQWLCVGQTPVQLKATSANGAAIEWLRNNELLITERADTLSVTEPGRYQIRVTDDGCQALSNETVMQPSTLVQLELLPQETDLILPQGATITLRAPVDTTYRYQWYRDNQALANALSNRLVVAQAGVYKVLIKQQSCESFSSERIVQTSVVTGMIPEPTGAFSIYPNPADHTLSVRYENPLAKQVQLRIYDLKGALQQPVVTVKARNSQIDETVSVQGLPSGNYVLQLTDDSNTFSRRFVKK
ncbi:S8 family peptidase [Spirosoma sp. BT702]|uniref:S8 family peptidase n=1 Tax=Spirosoma profusum TaxID=2771354 RepID=A0A927AQU0_9BACT|nr:S8 family serine peptidase [Spirosoma profusum]MBD2701126.1 S8 family peptidase [Spirosoma profusum]